MTDKIENFMDAVADYAQDLANTVNLSITIDTIDDHPDEVKSLSINIVIPENLESVIETFAGILRKNADLFEDEEEMLLTEIKANGFTTTFIRLLGQIADQCRDEQLLIEDERITI